MKHNIKDLLIMGEPNAKCLLFLKLYPKFQWFIDEYFPDLIPVLIKNAEAGNSANLMLMLNEIWFELPDDKFNIIINPEGWSEFLQIIES